jgi:predicted protein tyrosine phosphatase
MLFPTDGFRGDENYHGMQVEVMGIYSVRQYIPGPDEACISIYTDFYSVGRPLLEGFVDVLRLEFDDTTFDRKGDPDAKPFTPEMADDVAKFVLRNRGRKKLVIHCFAGVSRSRSMASAITEALDLPYNFTVVNKEVESLVRTALDNLLEEQ